MLKSTMLNKDLVYDVLQTAKSGGADFAELYVERVKNRAMRTVNREVKEATSNISYGAGLRLFYGTDVLYAYGNDLTREALIELTQTLIKLKKGQIDAQGAGGLDFTIAKARGLHAATKAADAFDKQYRLDRLLEIDEGARIDSKIKQVEGRLLEVEKEVLVANSEGTC